LPAPPDDPGRTPGRDDGSQREDNRRTRRLTYRKPCFKSPSHFTGDSLKELEPTMGFEPAACSLRVSCSTPELRRPVIYLYHISRRFFIRFLDSRPILAFVCRRHYPFLVNKPSASAQIQEDPYSMAHNATGPRKGSTAQRSVGRSEPQEGAGTRGLLADANLQEPVDILKHLEDSYTMQSERRIHLNHGTPAPGGPYLDGGPKGTLEKMSNSSGAFASCHVPKA
jgi:hypothetical protein